MLPDRVWNPGPLTYESGALPIALRGPALEFASAQADQNLHLSVSRLLLAHRFMSSRYVGVLRIIQR